MLSVGLDIIINVMLDASYNTGATRISILLWEAGRAYVSQKLQGKVPF